MNYNNFNYDQLTIITQNNPNDKEAFEALNFLKKKALYSNDMYFFMGHIIILISSFLRYINNPSINFYLLLPLSGISLGFIIFNIGNYMLKQRLLNNNVKLFYFF